MDKSRMKRKEIIEKIGLLDVWGTSPLINEKE